MIPTPSKRSNVILFFAAFALRIAYCAGVGGLGGFSGDGYKEYMITGERMLRHATLVSPLIADIDDATPSALIPRSTQRSSRQCTACSASVVSWPRLRSNSSILQRSLWRPSWR